MIRSKIKPRSRNTSHLAPLRRRQMFAELLEPRRLLAGDGDPFCSPDILESDVWASGGLGAGVRAEGEGEATPVIFGDFGASLRDALTEISRVVDSIGQSPTFDQLIPILGEAVPVDVGGTSIIDTDTVQKGTDKQATFFAFRSLSHKLASAVTVVIIGIGLSLTGFEPNVEQSQMSKAGIIALFSLLPGISLLLAGCVVHIWRARKL
ncbi:MAG: MFS transporter, partial [Planctomycetota bacterium]